MNTRRNELIYSLKNPEGYGLTSIDRLVMGPKRSLWTGRDE